MRPLSRRAAAALALLLLVGVAAPARGEGANPRLDEVQERIERGSRLFEAGDAAGALAEFLTVERSLQGHPMAYLVAFNVGQCYEQLFRYDQALEAYQRYLHLAPPDTPDLEQVRLRIAELEDFLGTVTLAVTVSEYEVWVDDHNLGSPTELRLPGGSHVIEVRAPGYRSARQEMTLTARSSQRLTFELEPEPEGDRGLNRGLFWASTGLGLATVVVGVVLAGLALGRHDELAAQLADDREGWLVTQDQIDGMEGLALGADLLFGLSGLFAVTSLVLAFFTDWGQGEAEGGEARPRRWLALGPSGLALGGAF